MCCVSLIISSGTFFCINYMYTFNAIPSVPVMWRLNFNMSSNNIIKQYTCMKFPIKYVLHFTYRDSWHITELNGYFVFIISMHFSRNSLYHRYLGALKSKFNSCRNLGKITIHDFDYRKQFFAILINLQCMLDING